MYTSPVCENSKKQTKTILKNFTVLTISWKHHLGAYDAIDVSTLSLTSIQNLYLELVKKKCASSIIWMESIVCHFHLICSKKSQVVFCLFEDSKQDTQTVTKNNNCENK